MISKFDIGGDGLSKSALEQLSESMFYVLLALLKQPLCGTQIAEFIHSKTRQRVQMGPGTLYTILSRFEEEHYIEEIAVEGRKRTYQITKAGKSAYLKEKARLYQMIEDAESEERL